MGNKAIVLVADANYTEQPTTTIKSILYHNQNVDIYVLNTDIMPDWFRKPRSIARQLGSEIHNVRIDDSKLNSSWKTWEHISKTAYARYLIPEYIDADKVLYLDSDIIVNGDLKSLFDVDLGDYFIGAVKDIDGSFNSGMMLINNAKWRAENLTEQLISQTNETMSIVERGEFEHFNGDQTILNQVCGQNWLELDKRFNLQVGHDTVAFFSGWSSYFSDDKLAPIIIHYTSYRKPWSTMLGYRHRNLWWQFHDLEFSQLISRHTGAYSLLNESDKGLDFFVLTASQHLENIDYLLEQLPNCRFHIAAYTDMGGDLLRLSQKYNNVYLYPQIVGPVLETLKEETDIYLDINHGGGTEDFVGELANSGKTIFSFYSTQNGVHGQYLFLSQNPHKMVEAIDLFEELGQDQFQLQYKQTNPFDVKVKTIDETLDDILENQKSVVRFGDGEFQLIKGIPIAFQEFDETLSTKLKEILKSEQSEQLLVCVPEVFDIYDGQSHLDDEATRFWKNELDKSTDFILEYCQGRTFGSAFISRPYIFNKDKTKSPQIFEKMKLLWKDRDILIVEGNTSRSGVGNDLFDGAKSIKRIICPSHSAYRRIDEIQDEILKHVENRLVLLMLGPTAKVLTWNLSKMGYQALDIGHIDSEYEWMKMGAETKVQLKHKHTAEFNFDQGIDFLEDEEYNRQIVADLSWEGV